MEIRWLEQVTADVPSGNEWFSADEHLILRGMKIPKRRSDWQLGRWAAKQAVAAYLQLSSKSYDLATIELRPAATGAPDVYVSGGPANISISLSHRDGTAACAVVSAEGVVGCDLELIEPRSDVFITDYFTPEEQEIIAHSEGAQRDRLVTILWSAKESALKALRTGLRVDTRSVCACLADPCALKSDAHAGDESNEWFPLRVREAATGQLFAGWWRCLGSLVRTVVSQPAADPPIPLLQQRLASTR